MQTIHDFIRSAGITMTAERWHENPNMDDRNMDHWRVKLRANRSQFTVYFSQGFGHNGKEPKLTSVLDCLASDAAGYENADNFEDWASEYGYDTDSRKAERTFKTVERQSVKLRRFLGESAYQTLLWNTERE